MVQLRLHVRTMARPSAEDDPSGEHLVSLVREATARGNRGAAAVVLRDTRVEIIDLASMSEAKIPLAHFLAALSRSEVEGFGPARAVGLVGRMQRRTREGGVPVALAFLEWSDCRWWQWIALLGADGQIVTDSETRRRAADGDPLPQGLGRWWTLGRRTKARVQYGPAAPQAKPPELVH